MNKRFVLLIFILLPLFAFSQNYKCLDFDGGSYGTNPDTQTDYVAMGDYSSDIGTTFTVECWFNADAITTSEYGNAIFASSPTIGDQTKPLWVALRSGELKVYTFVDNNDDFEITGTNGFGAINLSTDTWYHLAITADRGTSGRTKAYINGSEVLNFATKDTVPWSDTFTLADLRPGRGLGFDGSICAVRLWSDIRTVTEVSNNRYTAITSGDNLVGAWYYDTDETLYHNAVSGGIDGTLGTTPADPVWTDDCPLPVTLSIFNVAYHNAASVLTWTTQSETDNYGWNIYRSETDNFANSQIQNGEIIEGAGTTSIPTYYSFVDPYELVPEKEYWYWLENISYSGDSEFHGPLTLMTPTNQDEEDTPEVPDTYGLTQNYPNPFNPSTKIGFALPTSGSGELVIYDINGRKVKTVFTGTFLADHNYNLVWNGDDEAGKKVSSGIYFYRLTAGSIDQTKKMILMK